MDKCIVELTSEERKELTELASKGKATARRITRARILLQSDASTDGLSWTDNQSCLRRFATCSCTSVAGDLPPPLTQLALAHWLHDSIMSPQMLILPMSSLNKCRFFCEIANILKIYMRRAQLRRSHFP